MMRSSSKKSGCSNPNRGLSDRVSTLHQRLCHALNLGFSDRSYGNKERKWHSSDAETQRLVVRSISAFQECITADMLQHTSLRDSLSDMIRALEAILLLKNEAILSVAANEAVKLVSILPESMLQTHVLVLILPLSSLLSFHQSQVAVSCAIALHKILSKLSIKSENEVWTILKGIQTVSLIVSNLRDFSSGTMPIDYFKEMASLLSIILLRWPPARYHVWTDAKLMSVLQNICVEYDISTKVAILHLCSSIALCFYGASKLLVDGEGLLQMVVYHMDGSQPDLVRAEAFKLAQCLAMNEQGCKNIMSTCCEQIIEATISGMGGWISYSQKLSNDQMFLIVEACRFALVTRWTGEHHFFFWELGVDRVLLGILLNNVHKDKSYQNFNSLQQQITTAQECLKANSLQVLRPYIWDILGWLVTHCGKEFNPNKHGDKCSFSMLVTCACLVFVDLIHKGYRMCQDDPNNVLRSESACHTVLMMIYSPSKYISAQSRSTLSEILKLYDKDYLKYSLNTLNSTLHGNSFRIPDNLLTLISLMTLTCYSSLPQYQKDVIELEGIKTLMAFMKSCLRNQVHIGRPRVAPHLHYTFNQKMCCWESMNDWEGRDYLLLLSLQGLAEMVHYSFSGRNNPDTISDTMGYSAAQLIDELQEICIESDYLAPGPRWYAVYILSHFGVYDFRSPLGNRIRKLLNGEHADMQLILADSESLNVHGIILMARCPSLHPPGEPPPNEKTFDSSREKSMKEVRLSAYICYKPLMKLMEFIYSGYMLAEDNLVTSLKILARRCNVSPLLQLLSRKIPQWGTPFPRFDLTVTLGPAGHKFSDVIMEAKATKIMQWTCGFCSLPVPHMHVHKVILWSSCDYLRALLQSGMQESYSQRIKVPICWEALSKLVHWFYSGELPKPVFGCLWDSMDSEEKLHELLPYVELSWLAEYWFLNEVQEDSYKVIDSCLKSAQQLSLKIMQIAAEFSLWKLTETAANYMAPLYSQLRDSGDLEALDEDLIDMVRAASVRFLSQASQY